MSPAIGSQRIAILADIHGNSIALDAVLDDIRVRGGTDAYWFLGDYSSIGFDPVGVLERIAPLPNACFLRGNGERYIIKMEYPAPPINEAKKDLASLSQLVEVSRSFAWTQGCLTATGWMEWLSELPLEQQVELPDGTQVLLVHASPGTDGDPGIQPNASDDDIIPLLKNCTSDLLLVGHTHAQLDRQVNGTRIINPGSISNPTTSDIRAKYALLEANSAGYSVSFHRVAYDYDSVIDAMYKVQHPEPAYMLGFLEGKHFIFTD